MSESIKRFRVDFDYGRYFFDPKPDGDWVRHADHLAALEQLTKQLDQEAIERARVANLLHAANNEIMALRGERDALKQRLDSAMRWPVAKLPTQCPKCGPSCKCDPAWNE